MSPSRSNRPSIRPSIGSTSPSEEDALVARTALIGLVLRARRRYGGYIVHLGITIIGDFIIDPLYDEKDFAALERYVLSRDIDLPICSVMTPLPGTPLHERRQDDILIHDLEYYTLTNAVTRTRLPEEAFYQRYAAMMKVFHAHARL